VKAIGRQWYWSYNYPDHGNFTYDSFMVSEDELGPDQPRLLSVSERLVVPVGAKVRLITTPNGKGGMAWSLYKSEVLDPDPLRKLKWAYHKITIEDAVKAGLPVDIDIMREAYKDDPDGFAQECMCEFLDGSNVLLPYEIIQLGESIEASEVIENDFWSARGGGEVFCGVDFGRTNDPTVCWTLQREGDVLVTREVLVLREMDTPDQQDRLARRIARASRVSFDYTGPGIGLGDYLAKDYGKWNPAAHEYGKLDLCTFTVKFKREIFPKLRRAFEAPSGSACAGRPNRSRSLP